MQPPSCVWVALLVSILLALLIGPVATILDVGTRVAVREMEQELMVSILVVDDRPDDRLVLRLFLEEYGFVVLEADDGAAALRLAADQRPALIFMDLMLPVVPGWALARQMAGDPALASIPIIATSAYPLTARAVGTHHPTQAFEGYLVKPIEKDDLEALLRAFQFLGQM